MSKSKKLSRRDFARTSVAAGAAAVALPGALLGKEMPVGTTAAAAKGAAVARRRVTSLPPEVAYGGPLDGRRRRAAGHVPANGDLSGGLAGGDHDSRGVLHRREALPER